jgi:hypothetical protein
MMGVKMEKMTTLMTLTRKMTKRKRRKKMLS